MMRPASPLHYRRLRAPQQDGGVLFDPPLESCAQITQHNMALADRRDGQLGGQSFRQLAAAARAHVLQAARTYTSDYRDVTEFASRADATIIATGHQPELYHPGVWVKNFVLHHLAKRQAACAVHLLIDNDTLVDAAIRVPTGGVAEPRAEAVAFDRRLAEMPFEARGISDAELFASFATRVSQAVKPFVDEPLVKAIWSDALAAARETGNVGRSLARARHRLEGKWGLQTLEVPLSIVCDHASFRYFAAHLLSELPRFQQIHNTLLDAYRRENRVRSKSHPVPALETQEEWIEAPFWLWRESAPVRRRVFARTVAGAIEISDLHEIQHRLPPSTGPSADNIVDALERLTAQGLRLRPRALLTTMFTRLLLADLFIHGIGGAKYDQLTDAIIEQFFGFPAPRFLTATATVRLPIDRQRVGLQDLRNVNRLLREVEFNPQRHADDSAEAQRLAAAKQELISHPPTADQRARRHDEIAQLNNALRPFVESKKKSLLSERTKIQQLMRYEKVLDSREYAFCLFTEQRLRSFLLDI